MFARIAHPAYDYARGELVVCEHQAEVSKETKQKGIISAEPCGEVGPRHFYWWVTEVRPTTDLEKLEAALLGLF